MTDAGSLALLTAYFSDRQSSFPVEQGAYQTTFPVAGDFLPPNGVFLLVGEPSADPEQPWVGCGGIRRIGDAPDEGPRYEIKHLWLQPGTRGRGWGRALLVELERRARSFGAVELVLDTNSSLRAAASLYRSAGFEDSPPYNDNPNATNWYRKRLARGQYGSMTISSTSN